MYQYEYPRPALTVDCVLFGWDLNESSLRILLIERKHDPYGGYWALPGGFVDMDETTETAALRELEEETGVKDVFLEQLYTFSDVDRDPRGRVISVAYFALIRLSAHRIMAASDARSARWFSMDDLPPLAFDHDKIIQMAFRRLQGKVRYQPIGFELLPEKFTLPQLQSLYEAILEGPLDKRNFRKEILRTKLLLPLEEKQADVPHRAARLYYFDQGRYQAHQQEGFNFEIRTKKLDK
ncbi:MAG: NUDIX domain-containing protein [Bernardetiaceae bacterium]